MKSVWRVRLCLTVGLFDGAEHLKVAAAGFQGAAAQDTAAQASSAFEGFVGAGADGGIHPVAGSAFFASAEFDLAEAEALADEAVEVEARGQDVAAEGGGVSSHLLYLLADLGDDFVCDEGELTFEILLMVKVAVASESTACDALDLVAADDAVFQTLLAMSTNEIVAR